MPVTFTVASHPANPLRLSKDGVPDAETVLKLGCEVQARKCRVMLQSSLNQDDLRTIVPKSNGFVHAVLQAYGSHHHLRIRPDDVWLAILVQLNFYINAHTEELRSLFFAHEGKKRLVVKTVGNRRSVDYGKLTRAFTERIHQNVVDDTLAEWILPNFTTTTTKDRTVCSVVMMATLKGYFEYMIFIICGIPSVTLEGEKSDWEEIYRRLWRLYDFGTEPAVWAEMLRPIIRRFVAAFDGEPDVAFWSHIVYRNDNMCGRDDLSGWITAFCVWSNEGKWKAGKLPDTIPEKPLTPPLAGTPKGLDKLVPKWLRRHSESHTSKAPEEVPDSEDGANDKAEGSVMERGKHSYDNPKYTLDGVEFFVLPVGSIPPGYGEVDVTVNDHGTELDCMMIAGHVGYSASSTGESGVMDTVSPSPQWFMFVKK